MMKRLFTIAALMLSVLAAEAQVYVATDKSCYVAGDRILCSVFCGAGPSVAYLELVSTDGPAARARVDIRDGRGGGSLRIPVATPTGNYRLMAYTGPEDVSSGGPVISIFNTFINGRVRDGVEIVSSGEYGTPVRAQTGYGFAASTDGDIVLENTSGVPVTCCISLYREDMLQPAAYRSIAGFDPAPAVLPGSGETIYARLVGTDAEAINEAALPENSEVRAIMAVPGSKNDCYTGTYCGDGLFRFDTENVFGSVNMVFQLAGLKPGQECHLEPVSPFLAPSAGNVPKLRLCRSMEPDLLRRSASLAEEVSLDTVSVTLPMRRDHFFRTHECVSYILDDYTRFPTMEEVFVEITPNVKLRRRAGKPHIYVLMRTSVQEATPRWGDAMVMVDGVPVTDQKLIETYDPAIVKVVEVYPYRYKMGGSEFDGVVNLVTFKGNMPGVLFDDNVRIYDFQGCAWPEDHYGAETLVWRPLVTLEPGGKVVLPSAGMVSGTGYTLSVDGLTESGRPVYLRKSFVR